MSAWRAPLQGDRSEIQDKGDSSNRSRNNFRVLDCACRDWRAGVCRLHVAVYMTANLPECDCLIHCGDDPWLAQGKSRPCDARIKSDQDAAEFHRQCERDNRLRKFYSLGRDDDLVAALCKQIDGLQARLSVLQPRTSAVQRVRKG
jgi:hypothetical protein